MKIPGLYTYDRKNYCYRQITLKEVLSKTIKTGIVVGSIGFASLVALSHSGIWDINEVILSQKLSSIKSEIVSIEKELNTLDKELTNYYHKYNDFYANILPIKKISEGTWKAGVGGSKIYPHIKDDYLKNLLIKSDKLEYQSSISKKSLKALREKLKEIKTNLQELPIGFPTKGRIVSGFGYRKHPIRKYYHLHSGVDIDAPYGQIVKSTGKGVVVKAGISESGYGIQVEIDHGNGFKTKYAHLSKTLVKVGDKVERGTPIGKIGSTGLSTGPHLHYEIMKNKKKINPYPYLILGL